ncbi:MAG: GAF domain-containing protein [Anaerotignum sp.]|nr:GAF domain-containing protein [Anaerotignum sp.]
MNERRLIDIEKLLNIGISLSTEKDPNRLLLTILEAAMDITHCDGGTLYILNENALTFKIMITRSMNIHKGGDGENIDLPPVELCPENVCARAALEYGLINVPDVYNDPRFDFSGPRNYDAITGYKTTSMLVVPMQDDQGQVIGVLQLINAKDKQGSTTAFEPALQSVVLSLASQAAIRLTNMNYSVEIIDLLNSFVRVMSVAIDARSPYNANHTRNMARYGEHFLQWLLASGNPWQFTEGEKHQFLMSVWLHDVGKLVIPLEIMDKESRLGTALIHVEHRFQIIGYLNRIALLNGKLTSEEYTEQSNRLEHAKTLIAKVNTVGFLSDELLAQVDALAKHSYEDENGEVHPWLTPDEHHSLSVRKGTLTQEERSIMESHVVLTKKLLDEMKFSRSYAYVPTWAAAHHEFLNGKGYPLGLKGEEIPREVRLLTILDIFDALTARDRPYKPGMPIEKTLQILGEMAQQGQIDGEILALFIQSRAWE